MQRRSAWGFGKDGILDFDIVGQANHGVCAVAMEPWAAYEHIERLDHVCEIVLKSGVRIHNSQPTDVGYSIERGFRIHSLWQLFIFAGGKATVTTFECP
ncbi:MAG: hypothetical protein AB7P24_21610 [Nitrospira sp.]